MSTHARQSSDLTSTRTAGDPVDGFLAALGALLARYRLVAERRYLQVGDTGRTAHVLVSGDGPPLVLVIGGAVPAAFWVPLMAQLRGRRLYAIELPGFGLTDPATYTPATLRRTAVDHLAGILDDLRLGPAPFVTQSMGSQWTNWLAEEEPGRVQRQVMIACPAFFLDTEAIPPFRLASLPGLGRLLMTLQRPSTKNAERMLRAVGESPDGLEELRDVMLATQRLPSYTPSLLALMRSVMSRTRPRPQIVTTANELRDVRHPVRLIWGERDPFGTVGAGQRIADLVPDADLHVVPGGHAPWFHQAERVGRLTHEFLEDPC
jgi:2-hydroxy-6-oxonona-2,4-dienedioate hydrolase